MKELKKKLFFCVFTTLFTFGLLGTTSTAFGTTNSFHKEYDQLDADTKQQVHEILHSLKSDLEKMGLKTPEHKDKHEKFNNLDEETKNEVKDIITQLEDGKITKEEADKRLNELGISSLKKEHCKAFENLDEETKAKAKDIFKEMKDGTITKEEGKQKLKELGIELPKHPMRESFEKLDEETKEKIKERINEAKIEFEKLDVPFPKKYEYLAK